MLCAGMTAEPRLEEAFYLTAGNGISRAQGSSNTLFIGGSASIPSTFTIATFLGSASDIARAAITRVYSGKSSNYQTRAYWIKTSPGGGNPTEANLYSDLYYSDGSTDTLITTITSAGLPSAEGDVVSSIGSFGTVIPGERFLKMVLRGEFLVGP